MLPRRLAPRGSLPAGNPGGLTQTSRGAITLILAHVIAFSIPHRVASSKSDRLPLPQRLERLLAGS